MLQCWLLQFLLYGKESNSFITNDETFSLVSSNRQWRPIMGLFMNLQVLVEETKELKAEIKRLKDDNAKLIKKTKSALGDRDVLMVRTNPSLSDVFIYKPPPPHSTPLQCYNC